MDVCADADKDVGVEIAKLKSGVVICWVTAGGVNPEGVDACSVANKSGVEVGAAGMLHPEISRRKAMYVIASRRFLVAKQSPTSKRRLLRRDFDALRVSTLLAVTLFLFRLDGFKIKLLA